MFYVELIVGLFVLVIAGLELIQRLRGKASPLKSFLSFLWEAISW
jgi:hypothetical protein